jgi:hypothetical protein
MKKILFTALTVGSSMDVIAHSNSQHKTTWDEPSQHELVGAKAEDVYYFDDAGNLLGHFGQDNNKADRVRHVAGVDVDTEVPAAKLIDKPESTQGTLAEASSTSKSDGGEETTTTNDDDEPREARLSTPEERVARVAVTKSEKFKRAALKAAKEAAVSKRVANRATENAHAW